MELVKSPSRNIISVDIDDTLTPFNELAKKVAWSKYRETGDQLYKGYVYASLNQWRTPVDILSIEEWLEIVEECHSDENILNNQPIAGSVDIVNELAKNNDIYYVSNRAPSTFSPTKYWLEQCGFPMSENTICLDSQPKINFFVNEGVNCVIDDRPKTLVDFVYSGEARKGFGLLTEYNTALTDIDDIYLAHDWYGLAYFFEKEGII